MFKHIAMISHDASPLGPVGGADDGGQNIYVSQVAIHLARRGFWVDVFTRKDDLRQPPVVDLGQGLRVVHVPAGPPMRLPKEDLLLCTNEFTAYMKRFIDQQQDYDVVHANCWLSGLVARRLKQTYGTPFVVTFHVLHRVSLLHQDETGRFPPERLDIEEQVISDADRIIAECPQNEEDHVKHYRADRSKIRVIPCGFDENEFWRIDKETARRSLQLHTGEPLILHVGRLVPYKGIDTAIQGFARLVHREEIPARLIIVGGESDRPDPLQTPEIARLEQVARDEGVGGRVMFTGRRGRTILRLYYNAADVFLTTPWYETFGITPVESMACGTPVVGTNVGGVKYTVVNGQTGFLVPPKDPDAVADRVATLLRNKPLCDNFSRNAMQRAKDLFTWPRVAADIADVYNEILTTNGLAPPPTEPVSALASIA
jgi:glycosyltransferase involved in cell wall biosynthesis